MSIRIALILGFALAVGGYVGVRIYGHQQYEAGYEARDIRATLERNKQNQEVFDEQQRLQAQRDEAELRFVNLKMATDGERDALAGVLERLRKQTRGVLSKRATPSAGGRVDGAGGDWITGYAACYEEYAAMGIDYARTADKLRGMQDHERSVQSDPVASMPK